MSEKIEKEQKPKFEIGKFYIVNTMKYLNLGSKYDIREVLPIGISHSGKGILVLVVEGWRLNPLIQKRVTTKLSYSWMVKEDFVIIDETDDIITEAIEEEMMIEKGYKRKGEEWVKTKPKEKPKKKK